MALNLQIHQNKVPYTIPQPNNMGAVRYILALSVVIAHFKTLCGFDFYFPISSYSGVGGFFVLSGFLIYGSYLKRPKLKSYILSRVRRIMPAYWLTVISFAIICSFFSTDTLSEYFSSTDFWKYLASNMMFLNFLKPDLPGIFTDLAIPAVNGSLWTMKVEWTLYLSVPIVFLIIKKLKGYSARTFILIIIFSMCYRILFHHLYLSYGKEIYNILGRQVFGQFSYFYIGVLIYFYYNFFVNHNKKLLFLGVILTFCGKYLPYSEIIIHPIEMGIYVIWFSMIGKWGKWLESKNNISYNIYLVHFPIMQLMVWVGITEKFSGWYCFIIMLIIVVLYSYILNLAERIIKPHIPIS